MSRRVFVLWLAVFALIGMAGGIAAPEAQTPASPLPKLAAAPGATSCTLVSRPVVVELNDVRTPEAVEHVREAVRAGEARLLHIDRVDADAHRAASLRGVKTAPGKDRDEYPPALSVEGGAGADVKLIPSGDNRSAGSTMKAQLAPFCEGQAFIIEEGLP